MYSRASCCCLVPGQWRPVSGVLGFREVVAAEAGIAAKGTVEVEPTGNPGALC